MHYSFWYDAGVWLVKYVIFLFGILILGAVIGLINEFFHIKMINNLNGMNQYEMVTYS